MYTSFYGFSEEPFSITCDPKFLWLRGSYEEAFAHIYYAIANKRGFAVLTGGVGTGKTTLINSVLAKLGGEVNTAVVYNSSLNTDELLQYIFHDFGIEGDPPTRAQALMKLNDWLIEQAAAERNTVILVDEAQNLSVETLEDLRLLSNLETAKRKLLQIVLVGQTELNEKLALHELRQLQQRIAIRFHLRALRPEQTREYIHHRLEVAGCDRARELFQPAAIDRIHEIASGIPRVINQVCDTTLLRGYSRGIREVDRDFIEEVVAEDFSFRDFERRSLPQPVSSASPEEGQPAQRRRRGWFWAAAVPVNLMLLFLVYLVSRPGAAHEESSAVDALQSRLMSAEHEVSAYQEKLDSLAVTHEARIETLQAKWTRQPVESAGLLTSKAQVERTIEGNRVRIRIRENDTLVKIAMRELGRADWAVIETILVANPQIENPNLIRIGDFLWIPLP